MSCRFDFIGNYLRRVFARDPEAAIELTRLNGIGQAAPRRLILTENNRQKKRVLAKLRKAGL